MQLGLGTAAIGRPQYINIKQEIPEFYDLNGLKTLGYEVLNQAYKLGVRYFDTAPGYGMAENLLIEWAIRKNDSSVRIGTKWGYTYVANFDPNAKVHEIKEHSLSKLIEQWEVSKQLMPNLNFYQIHSATLDTGVLENKSILNQLADLKEKFGIKIGITTTGDNQLEALEKALSIQIKGMSLIDTFQSTYNVLDQSILQVYNKLKKENKTLIVKEALANGRLFRNKKFTKYKRLYDYSEQIASKYKVGVDAIFLRFCMQTLPNAVVLSGASNIEHIQSNLKANDFQLSEDEIHHLSEFKIESGKYWQERKALSWH